VPHQITLIPGDGIGPEVADATARAVDATGAQIEWDRVEAGVKAEKETGKFLPDSVFASLERTRVGLKGPIATPIATGHPSVNVALRKRLDLYVNFRPIKMLPGLKTRFSDLPIDMIIFRENTEDLYSGLEHEIVKDVVTSLKVITRTASARIARYAFSYARKNGRKQVVAIHKANIMKLADGLFLRCCRETAKDFPDIAYKELIVDNACMQLVMRPETFDVLVLPNLYGDIVSDLCAGLVGTLLCAHPLQKPGSSLIELSPPVTIPAAPASVPAPNPLVTQVRLSMRSLLILKITSAPTGDSGQTLDVYFQHSADDRQTWSDCAEVHATATGTYYIPFSAIAAGPTSVSAISAGALG